MKKSKGNNHILKNLKNVTSKTVLIFCFLFFVTIEEIKIDDIRFRKNFFKSTVHCLLKNIFVNNT